MRTMRLISSILWIVLLLCLPAAGETFRFTATADNRPYDASNLSRWEWLLDEMTRLVGDEGVFHIMPGDFDYPGTTDASLKTQFGSDVIWYPVTGNHEAETPEDMTWVRSAYSGLPYIVNTGPTNCETTTYSFDYGNAHFVAINEYYTGTADVGADGDVVQELYDWLAADLAANTKPAIFVIGHEPAYPQYAHVGDSLDGHPANRDRFWKLLNDEKVTAYFCGHTHWYSALQQSQTGDYPCEAFTWQIDCGNAGNPREAEQTFIDITVTDTDVTFVVWQGIEDSAYSVRESWTVDIPLVAASNPLPADGAAGVMPWSVTLSATVENPSGSGDPVDVEFFGAETPGFSIVVLPDTQKYVNVINGGNPEIFTSQTEWIAANTDALNIVFVTHEGDLTDSTNRPAGMDVAAEWLRANTSMSILDGVVPYGVLPGNHDFPTTYYESYFPYTRYESEAWYGGHYGTTNENSFQLFSAGGDDYIILHLQYDPDSSVTSWASSVLETYSSRKAIITTHSYFTSDGSLTNDGGTIIWDDLVVPSDNVFFVLCGHNHGEQYVEGTVGSRTVHQIMANYQDWPNGGNGLLRIMRFEPDEDRIYVQTYSPWLDQYESDSDSDFELAFDMTGTGYASIGIDSGVSSGSTASTIWPDLVMETAYEWYVVVSDTMSPAIASGPVWNFTTASLKASNPSPSNGSVDVDLDADLSWSSGAGAASHDVYFGTDPENLALVSAKQAATTYDPGQLGQGITYYWSIDEFDSGDNLLATGDVWSFTTTMPSPDLIISAGAQWKYFDAVDSDQGAWYGMSFDDSGWSEGPAQLGYGDGDESTILNNSPIRASYYFRHTFTSAVGYDHLTVNAVRDDGCVVYLNGVEIGRSNMSSGEITWDTWAASVTTNEGDWWGIAIDPAVVVQPGVNVLAVSVHQAHSTSSDVSFDFELLGVQLAGQPVANDDSDTTDEDTDVTIDVLGNDTDPDNDPLVVESVTQPANGSVVNNGTDVTYTPSPNFNGIDTFTYKATDGTSPSNSATVTVTVNAVNDAPAAEDQAVSTKESTPVDITLTGSDPENDPLTFSVLTGPTKGTLSGVEPDLTYTPDPGYVGVDSFTFDANDGVLGSVPATISITVNANSIPVADDQAVTGNEDTSLAITLTGGDADGDPLSYHIVSAPSNGGLSGTAPNLIYTPDADFYGTDSFIFNVNDGTADSAPATVSITVTAVNDDPVANDDSVTTDEDTPVAIPVLANDTDTDGDSLSVESVTQPANGTANVDGNDIVYTPNANFNGDDSFGYTVGDGNGGSASGTVNITIDPINDRPTAPENLSASPGDSVVNLNWDDNIEQEGDLVGYNVYRSETPGSYGTALAFSSTSDYSDNGVVNDRTYYYVVKAVDSGGLEGDASNEVSATPVGIDYDAYASVEPIVTIGGTPAGTVEATTAGDGVFQTIDEAPDGPAAYSLRVEYVLHTAVNPGDVSEPVTINLIHSWTGGSADGLLVELFIAGIWTDITTDIADGQCEAAATNIIDAEGNIRIRFADTVNKKKESRDTLGIDLLYADIIAGPAVPDTEPPLPDPMTWSSVPQATGASSISMTATAASDASGVEYYFECLTAGGHDSDWQDSPTYEDTGLTADIEYTYRVQARDKSPQQNATGWSAEASATPVDVPPSAPSGLTATAGDGQVSLDWADNSESDLAGYNVYRSETTGGPYASVNSGLVGVSEYVDSTAVNGTTYYYVVTAVDSASPSANESGYSSEVSARPGVEHTIYVSAIEMSLAEAGKNHKATAGITLSEEVAGATVYGDWYFEGAIIQSGANGITDSGGYTAITSAPEKTKGGEVFRFVVTDVVLGGYTYDSSQGVTENSITVP
ncbi:MAG: tandem-95 repeat protein [Sedimentisphaerales bacterium]|nr:tandem-95 repeat protein [Sedimentisphaerales bacterium]